MNEPEFLGSFFDSDFDVLHRDVVWAVCETDRVRCAAGEKSFLRLATEHEFCRPEVPCIEGVTLVQVDEVEPGVRTRVAIFDPLPS